MFEALGAKILTTVASVSTFLFSSYTGNDPSLRPISTRVGDNYIQVETRLENAFVNDFEDIFKSGTSIPVVFKLKIRSGRTVFSEMQFINRVRYDHAKGLYLVSLEGMNRNLQLSSPAQLVSEISALHCSLPYDRKWGKVTLSMEASLSAVRFQQVKGPVDLMVLWKYRKPKASKNLDLTKEL